MNPEQARNLVEKTFKHSFDRVRFLQFAQELLNHLDTSRQKRWSGNVSSKDAFKDKINHYERLGSYRDPNGEDIDVLVIHLKKETTLERGRTSLRNFAADYLTQRNKSAVLAAFVGKDASDWRFSFVKLEYTTQQTEDGKVRDTKELTPARRYSFLVGSHEGSHTAQKQFLPLLENDQSDPTLEEIEEAFDIERVTKEFFARYKDLFERVRDALDELLKKNKSARDEFEKRGVETDDFAKKLLGQIVFLYFLQKKGWFGVKRGEEWGDGDKNYLRHLFDQRETYYGRGDKETRRNFFNDILQPLFYNTLATERTGDYSDRFRCKIPFLNGGLFEPLLGDNWFNIDILLADELFSNDIVTKDGDKGTGVLDVFDRYNFTVNEAEPLEREVAVDPEMLGKVFENLLPENLRYKGGTYYTPRVIVSYMCQQSLINYLTTHLSEVPRADIETFIYIGYAQADYEAAGTKAHEKKFLPENISSNAARIDKLLEKITVCDPAIGSGAFPVGMMQEIVRARLALQKTGEVKERSAYDLKHHAIHNSLYGVDIDPGAVEIAKLRLWLSLIVDEEDRTRIQALPNLDYKIMQGNALLDEFAGVKLLDDKMFETPASSVAAERAAIQARIRELQDQLYALHKQGSEASALKKKFSKETDRLVAQSKELDRAKPAEARSLLDDPYSEARSTLEELRRAIDEFFSLSSPQAKRAKRAKIEGLEWRFMEQTLTARGEQEALHEFEKHRRDNRKPYFLWKLYFADVFTEKGGFDVVIGNPPYLRVQGLQETQPELVPRYRANYKSAQGSFDIYALFIEFGYSLLNPKGEFAYIAPHKFFQATFGKALRELLVRRNALRHVVRFGAEQVFENPTTYTCLLFLSALPQSEFDFVDVTSLSNPDVVIGAVANRQDSDAFERGVLPAPSGDDWDFVVGGKGAVLAKLQEQTVTLGDITRKIFQGIATSADKIFVLKVLREKRDTVFCYSKATESEVEIEKGLVKPFLMGKDVHRYEPPHAANIVIFPYNLANGKATLMTQSFIRQNFPLGWKYLLANKTELAEREHGRFKDEWHSFSRPQNLTEFAATKIMTPEIALGCQMTMDTDGMFYHTTKVYSFVFKDNLEDDPKYLLGVLNSKVLWFFLSSTGYVLRGGYFTFKTDYLKPFPIPCSLSENPPTSEEQTIIATLVDYILFLKADTSGSDSRDQLMLSYFEQIINALVYELYLTDELHEADRTFFEPLAAERLSTLADIKGDKRAHLRRIFERLFDREHPVRQNIFFLDTLESVRIIEGKA